MKLLYKLPIVVFVITLFFVGTAFAQPVKHTIDFGSYFYNPNSLTVTVGDTVEWQGNEGFAFHPLQSTSVPSGASQFSSSSGTVYSYIVTAAGNYNYVCLNHSTLNMTGSFTATLTSIGDRKASAPEQYELHQNFPNPFNPSTIIRYSIPSTQSVTLKIFDLLGNEVATLVNETKSPGSYEVEFDGRSLASGIYLYKLETKNFRNTKKLLILK